MIGMGLTFSLGVGVVASVLAGLAWLLLGGDREVFRLAVASSIWAFPVGVAFSGGLALIARGRSFEKLSLPGFAALGAGAGLLLFGVLSATVWGSWSLANATVLALLGGGSASASLMLARRAGSALESGDDAPSLGAG
jgi:hypothetical protein